MSTLFLDSKVLQTKRKGLKGAEASLRDQISKDLFTTLNEKDLGKKLVEIWMRGNSNRSEWLARQQQYLADVDEFKSSTAEGPFAGSSNLHVPMPLIACKALHARYLQALTGVEPWFNTKARREDSVDRTALVQDVMDYSLREWGNNYQGAYPELDKWVWTWVTAGAGLLKDRWEVKWETYMDVREKQEAAPPLHTVHPQTGQELVVPQSRTIEEEVEVTEKVFEGPMLDFIQNEDVLIVGGKGDPQQADSVHHSSWLTASQLWTLVDRGIFDQAAVELVIKGGEDRVSGKIQKGIEDQRKVDAGISQIDTENDLDRYEIIECYLSYDVKGNGINSEIVVWYHPRTKQILHANYLRRMNKSGERPIFKVDYHIRPDQDYGIGVLEMLHPLSVEMDAHHNMRVDFGLYSAMPFGFYRGSSSVNPETIYYEPGSLIPMDNPQTDVYFPNLGNRTAFGFQEEQAIQTMVERLIGVNDMTTGTMTGAQGATRTATGVRGLMGEQNANLDVFLTRLLRGWKQVLRYRLHMLQQRIPKGLSFRVTGETGDDYWNYIKDQNDICGDFDFEVCANSANSNPQIQQQLATENMQVLLNPLLIQIGIVNAGNIYAAVKDWFKARGVKDFSKYCTQPPNYQHMLSPEDEANRILRSIPVPVTPEMDHQGFIDFFQHIHDNDELLGQFSKQQTQLLAAQAQKHQQMLQALQQQQAQVANQQQGQINAQMNQHAARPGMNPQAAPPPQGMPGGGNGLPQ